MTQLSAAGARQAYRLTHPSRAGGAILRAEGHDAQVMTQDPVGHDLRDILVGHQEGEQYRVGDDVEQHGGHAGRIQQYLGNL